MKSILRQAKNTVMQFSDIECKVREATSNDSWGASTSQMAEIAKATNNYQDYPQLFAMLWKRLNDVEHIMHVQKALILVEYLLRNGADRFINDAKRRARDIAQLKKYKHYDANNQDDAKEARAKAKIVYDMLMDDAKLQEERAKALKIKDVRLTGFGSDGGSRYGGHGGDSYGNDSGYGRGSGDYSHGNGNGSTGTVAAPPRRRKDSHDEGDPFDDDAPSSAPAKKGAAKDKTAAATTPDGEPVKKKKKKKVPLADAEATESTPEPTKLEAPAADGKKKKKKKKAVVEEKEENGGDDFANPFDNAHSNGQASQAYSAAANSSSFVDEFASAIPITYQQPQQDIDILTGRAPISLQTSGDLVDIFSSPTPASPMNQQKLEQIAQQPFDPLGRDPNYRPSPEQKAIEGPKDLWAVTDLMNLNDITKSTAKPAKKIAAAGPTMAELRAKNPGSTDASFSNIGFNNAPAAAAPPMQTPPFQPPMYPNAAPMGYPPLHQQMAGMNMGYPPQPYGYAMPGYQQPMLALMPPSAYQTGPPALMPPTSSGPSGHADLPFAVTPGSRPAPAYNSSKPVIFEVPSAQQVAQAKVDPHYNYNTQQRVTQRPTSNLASNW